jgi:hypothetical protein
VVSVINIAQVAVRSGGVRKTAKVAVRSGEVWSWFRV